MLTETKNVYTGLKKIINGRYRIYLGLRKNACLSTVMTIFHLCRIITTRVTRLHQPMMRAYKVILIFLNNET